MYAYHPWPWYYWAVAPAAMVGAEVPPVPNATGVVTRTTAEGTALTCPLGGTFRYRPNLTVEILRSRRLREGLFYLVVTTDGCAGWVPAEHVAPTRRQAPGGAAAPDTGAVAADA